MSEPVASFLLIAVLHSSIPLPPALSTRLYQAALDLCRSAGHVSRISGDLGMGEVRRLSQDLLLGAISGPGFEADLDTPRGSGRVRFIVTRQALAHEGIEGGGDDVGVPTPRRGPPN